jgi:hypothetical protein
MIHCKSIKIVRMNNCRIIHQIVIKYEYVILTVERIHEKFLRPLKCNTDQNNDYRMANLLIGSSNVSRFYGNRAPKGYREYQLVKCTDFNSFKSQLTDVKPNIKCVVISVIENFLADKVGKEIESPDSLIIDCLNEFVSTIESTVARLPDTRIGVVMPLGRPALQWYQD